MDIRFRFFIVLMMGLLIGAVWTFPQWYPLLNDDTISEAYGGLPLDAQASYVALPPDVQRAFETLRDGDEDLDQEPRPDVALALVEARLLSENVVTSEEEQAFTPPSETILRRGTFRQIDPIRGAQGDITIYQNTDLSRIMRIENFTSTRAPDVHVIFTRNPDPTDEAGVGVDYIDLGTLKGNVGGQTYRVPDSVNFATYPIVALYSVELDYVISTATLR
jgi:hypothetical protein